MIAMALALEPAVLVADEPTTALDVTTQAQILKLIRDLQRRRNMAVMFITHDFGVVAEIADRVVVLQHGKVVEQGTADDVLLRAQHPYTRACLPPFPPCSRRRGLPARPRQGGGSDRPRQDLCQRRRLVPRRTARAGAKEVSFDIFRGETLGLVGESGSGKSSVARLVMRLIEPDAGTVRIGDVDLTRIKGKALREQRRRIQMVFQDPFASLNPRRKVGNIITDGPIAHGVDPAAARKRAGELLELVGLNASAMERFPHEFSGGQRQRIGIARALALDRKSWSPTKRSPRSTCRCRRRCWTCWKI
jgi:peptide/nickel transport system ATP-binding protein